MMKPKIEMLDNQAPTVSQRILADGNRIEYETDKRGRRIGVKQLEFIDIHRLAKVIGGETAGNPVAYAQVLGAASVVEIDGDPIPKPGTNLQVEALMTRLGLAGIEAASQALSRFGVQDEESAAEIKN